MTPVAAFAASQPPLHLTLAPDCIVAIGQPVITYRIYNLGSASQMIAVTTGNPELTLASPADQQFTLEPNASRAVAVLTPYQASAKPSPTPIDTRVYFMALAPNQTGLRLNRGIGALVIFSNRVCKTLGTAVPVAEPVSFPWWLLLILPALLAIVVASRRIKISWR